MAAAADEAFEVRSDQHNDEVIPLEEYTPLSRAQYDLLSSEGKALVRRRIPYDLHPYTEFSTLFERSSRVATDEEGYEVAPGRYEMLSEFKASGASPWKVVGNEDSGATASDDDEVPGMVEFKRALKNRWALQSVFALPAPPLAARTLNPADLGVVAEIRAEGS